MRYLASVLLIVLALATGAVAAIAPGLSLEQQRRLAGGDIVLLDSLPPGAGSASQGGTALTVVNAPPDTVWHVVVNYRGHSGLYPRVVGAEVVESDEQHALVRYVIGVGPFVFGFHVNNYPDPARRRLVWRLADDRANNLFRETSGYWQIDGTEAGSMLTYAMAARTVLPAFVTRSAERHGLIQTITAVRKRAEEAARLAQP